MHAQVGVVGVGSVGSMALWSLARRGIDCLGIERFTPGHDRAAAGGESRLFRTAYLEGPEYVPLLLRSRELWRELEQTSGRDLLTLNGGVMIGPETSQEMRNVVASAEQFDLPHRVLDSAGLRAELPQHRQVDGMIGVVEEWAGFLRPEFAVYEAARAAERDGATVFGDTVVHEIDGRGDHWTIRTDRGDHTVERLLVSPGPWTASLVPGLADHVETRRLIMTWYLADDVAAYAPDRFPVFIRTEGGRHIFGAPTLDGGTVKVAPHGAYGPTDPDDLDRDIHPGELDRINDLVARWFSGLSPAPVRTATYMEAYTSDNHGVVGRLPGEAPGWVLGSFSGHGFKMAPALGEIGADLATTGEPRFGLDHLDAARFLGNA